MRRRRVMMTALEKMVQIEDSSAEKRAMRAGPRPSKPEGAAKRSVPEATTSSAPLRNQNQNQNKNKNKPNKVQCGRSRVDKERRKE